MRRKGWVRLGAAGVALAACVGAAVAADLVRLEDGGATLRLRIQDTGSLAISAADPVNPALVVTNSGGGGGLLIVDGTQAGSPLPPAPATSSN